LLIQVKKDCLLILQVASGWLYFSIISCVIGTSFSFGYSMGCINTPALVNKDYCAFIQAHCSMYNIVYECFYNAKKMDTVA